VSRVRPTALVDDGLETAHGLPATVGERRRRERLERTAGRVQPQSRAHGRHGRGTERPAAAVADLEREPASVRQSHGEDALGPDLRHQALLGRHQRRVDTAPAVHEVGVRAHRVGRPTPRLAEVACGQTAVRPRQPTELHPVGPHPAAVDALVDRPTGPLERGVDGGAQGLLERMPASRYPRHGPALDHAQGEREGVVAGAVVADRPGRLPA
jgi:hypothetical protein